MSVDPDPELRGKNNSKKTGARSGVKSFLVSKTEDLIERQEKVLDQLDKKRKVKICKNLIFMLIWLFKLTFTNSFR